MKRFLSRVLISMAAVVAAIVLGIIAVVFLAAALYLQLVAMCVAPPLAALCVGLTGLVLAGLLILAVRIASRRGGAARTGGNPGSAGPGPAGNVSDLAARLGGLAAQELTAQAQAHPYRAVAASLLAGLAVGGSPELRTLLKKALKD